MLKAEQETVIRWDQSTRVAHLWTAYEPDARRWMRAGYEVIESAHDRFGTSTSWTARVPVEAIRYRKVIDGQVARRPGHRKGRLLGQSLDEFIGVEP